MARHGLNFQVTTGRRIVMRTEAQCILMVRAHSVQTSSATVRFVVAASAFRNWLQAAYAEHGSISGGTASVSSLQLCSMAGRQRDEYYQV